MKSAHSITAPLGHRPGVVFGGVLMGWDGNLIVVAIWLVIGFGVTELVASFIESHSLNRVAIQNLEDPVRVKSP